MENIITVELSQSDGYIPNNGDNSEWITNIKENILIEEGDVVQLKQAIINTQNASSGNLVFSEDQDISITYGYYITVPQKDFAQNGNRLKNMLKRTENVTEYAEPGVAAVDNLSFTTLQKDNPELVKYYVLRNRNSDGGTYDLYKPSTIVTNTFTYTLTAGSYAPQQIADIITQELSKDENLLLDGIFHTGNSYHKTMFSIDLTNTYQLKGLGGNPNPSVHVPLQFNFVEYKGKEPALGATQTQLKWDQNSFSWKILHTPRYDSGGTGLFPITVESWYKTKPVVNYNQYSGIFITNLSPSTFWDRLGFTDAFNQEHIYPTDSNGKNINEIDSSFTASRFDKFITSEFFGNESRIDSKSDNASFINKNTNDGLILLQSSATNPLRAGGSYQSDTQGFFLIEIESGYGVDYFDIDSRQKYLSAIVSKNYNSFDFITAYGGQSGMTYIHKGQPQSISNFKVRILNPDKSNVTTLGTNSTIFLEIIKHNDEPNKKSDK